MIKYENVNEYWDQRSSRQGKATVGFAGHNLEQQEDEYKVKIDFVSSNLISFKGVTLDYGCGVGRFANTFENYIGVELTQNLYEIATEEYPNKTFIKVNSPFEVPNVAFDQVFTSTVLQHNHPDSIDAFFKTLSTTAVSRIALYENDCAKAPHCRGRSTEQYAALLEKYFEVETLKSVSHIVHGEKHTLSIFSLTPKDKS